MKRKRILDVHVDEVWHNSRIVKAQILFRVVSRNPSLLLVSAFTDDMVVLIKDNVGKEVGGLWMLTGEGDLGCFVGVRNKEEKVANVFRVSKIKGEKWVMLKAVGNVEGFWSVQKDAEKNGLLAENSWWLVGARGNCSETTVVIFFWMSQLEEEKGKSERT